MATRSGPPSSIVTIASQELLPSASVAVKVTIFSPTSAQVKEFGDTSKVNESPLELVVPPSTSDASIVTVSFASN